MCLTVGLLSSTVLGPLDLENSKTFYNFFPSVFSGSQVIWILTFLTDRILSVSLFFLFGSTFWESPSFFFFYCSCQFWWNWGLNSEPHDYWAGILPLESLHQPFFALGIFEIGSCKLFSSDPPDRSLPNC
jgi:hypothetical protein